MALSPTVQYPGELAAANQPILTVMNMSRPVAKAHIAQDEAILLKVGDKAEVLLSGVEDVFPAQVSLISPALDPGSTTIEVWIETLKADPALKPGMNVRVAASAKTVQNAIVVPVSAVFKSTEGEGYYVMLAGTDGKAHQTKVTVGIRNKELAEITDGLKENDPVIISGGYALPDGSKIQIESATAEGDATEPGTSDSSPKSGDADKKPVPPAKTKE